MEGKFTIDRSIFDSWIFADPRYFKIWIWLIGKARFKDGFVNIKIGRGYQTIELKKGQLLYGRASAENALCLDGSLIYRAMKKMVEQEMVLIESNNQYSIITICNYDSYQSFSNESEQPTSNQRTTNEQPTIKQCTTNESDMNTKNKDNKEKKEKKLLS